jgi:hypothetical protein
MQEPMLVTLFVAQTSNINHSKSSCFVLFSSNRPDSDKVVNASRVAPEGGQYCQGAVRAVRPLGRSLSVVCCSRYATGFLQHSLEQRNLRRVYHYTQDQLKLQVSLMSHISTKHLHVVIPHLPEGFITADQSQDLCQL